MNAKPKFLISTVFVLSACGQSAEQQAAQQTTVAAAPLAPAIIAPDEVANPAEPPSYDVAIATAAADHNKSLERCAAQPEAVRTQCEQEANAAFSETESKLQDLRGNQE